jgi:hypothetical protein
MLTQREFTQELNQYIEFKESVLELIGAPYRKIRVTSAFRSGKRFATAIWIDRKNDCTIVCAGSLCDLGMFLDRIDQLFAKPLK